MPKTRIAVARVFWLARPGLVRSESEPCICVYVARAIYTLHHTIAPIMKRMRVSLASTIVSAALLVFCSAPVLAQQETEASDDTRDLHISVEMRGQVQGEADMLDFALINQLVQIPTLRKLKVERDSRDPAEIVHNISVVLWFRSMDALEEWYEDSSTRQLIRDLGGPDRSKFAFHIDVTMD